jgi:2-polyprenyl-3-methyl-5-hydroxy-6-metoxy-1,4-benzoquinol methylase
MSYIFEQAEYEGLMYTEYKKYEFFSERAGEIKGRFSNKSISILVAGCGVGYLIQELINMGYINVVGIDASNWATSRAVVASRTVKGDIFVSTDLQKCKTLAGLKGGQKFDICITEDVLPCCYSENEVKQMVQSLKTISTTVFHIITCGNQTDDFRHPSLLWRTSQQWKQIIGNDLILDVETRVVV